MSRRAADQLGLDTKLEDEVATIIADVERVLDEWTKKRSMLPPLEESPRGAQDVAMEVEDAERAVVPAADGRGASSEAWSVVSSVRKVSGIIPLQLLGLTMASGGELLKMRTLAAMPAGPRGRRGHRAVTSAAKMRAMLVRTHAVRTHARTGPARCAL